jgi:hypothetical protein
MISAITSSGDVSLRERDSAELSQGAALRTKTMEESLISISSPSQTFKTNM